MPRTLNQVATLTYTLASKSDAGITSGGNAGVVGSASSNCVDDYFTIEQFETLHQEIQQLIRESTDRAAKSARLRPSGEVKCTQSLVGHGNYGSCMHAVEWRTGRELVAKDCSLHQDHGRAREQLENEIEILRCISHPNIVSFAGATLEDGKVILLLEYCDGGTLDHQIAERPLDIATSRSCIRQLMDAVNYLHKLGIVHGDIKPGNVLLQKNRVKLCDFGTSFWVQSGHQGELISTPAYLAPEVINGGKPNRKSDIWALGAVGLKVLTLQHVYDIIESDANSSTHWTRIKIMSVMGVFQQLELPQWLSPDALSFLSQCLQKDQHQRPTASTLFNHSFITRDVEDAEMNWRSKAVSENDSPDNESWSSWKRMAHLMSPQRIWGKIDGSFPDRRLEADFVDWFCAERYTTAMGFARFFCIFIPVSRHVPRWILRMQNWFTGGLEPQIGMPLTVIPEVCNQWFRLMALLREGDLNGCSAYARRWLVLPGVVLYCAFNSDKRLRGRTAWRIVTVAVNLQECVKQYNSTQEDAILVDTLTVSSCLFIFQLNGSFALTLIVYSVSALFRCKKYVHLYLLSVSNCVELACARQSERAFLGVILSALAFAAFMIIIREHFKEERNRFMLRVFKLGRHRKFGSVRSLGQNQMGLKTD